MRRYANMTPKERSLQHLYNDLMIGSRLDGLERMLARDWDIPRDLEENLREVTKSKLLDPQIRSYVIRTGRIRDTIVRQDWNLPVQLLEQPAIKSKIDHQIGYFLTQTKSSMKKQITGRQASQNNATSLHPYAVSIFMADMIIGRHLARAAVFVSK